jgi:hypothetical protein
MTENVGGTNMFDEKSGTWIKIYKVLAILMFFGFIALGIWAGIGDSSSSFLDIGLGGDDDGFRDFIMWVLVGGIVGFCQLVTNMLIIQFLNNVQIIREKMESK